MNTEAAALEISRWHVANGHPELQNKRRNPFKPHILWSNELGWCFYTTYHRNNYEEWQLYQYCVDQDNRWCPI